MKRDAYGDDGPMQKRQRQTDDEVTFLIPSKVAGSIIGKGGSNISKLRNEYKASITVPDCPGPERVLSITASDIDTIMEIVKDILPNLADGAPKGGTSDDLDVRLLIHQSRAGCVIGKAGAKIKELREKTGARLKIFSNPAPQSSERVVQLVGKPDAVAAGVREVLHLIRQVPIKGGIQNYDPHNYDDFYADEYGGFGSGQGPRGAGPRGGPPRGPPRGPPPMGPGGRPPPPRGGPPMGRNGPPPPRAFNDFAGPGPRGNFNGPPRGNFGGGGGGGGGVHSALYLHAARAHDLLHKLRALLPHAQECETVLVSGPNNARVRLTDELVRHLPDNSTYRLERIEDNALLLSPTGN